MMSPLEADPARFQPASDQSLLVHFGDSITPESSERVLKLLRLLEADPLPAVRNLHPGYASLLIKFDALRTTHAELESELRGYLARLDETRLPAPRLVEIPVCYGDDFGPDLSDLARLHDLTIEDVIRTHTAPIYTVCFLGFAPGFAYLSGLPANLVTPRLATPRRQVQAGGVGIAGRQTGVYPCSTPGGWQLIGRTPLQMFRVDRSAMSLLNIGDRVRFTSISRQRFAAIEQQLSATGNRA
jgi:inhibitor of KinA